MAAPLAIDNREMFINLKVLYHIELLSLAAWCSALILLRVRGPGPFTVFSMSLHRGEALQ
jgi:hypothetical protein